MTEMQAAQEVLDFWFGEPAGPESGRSRPVWFRKDADFDALVRARFGALHAQAMNDRLQSWFDAPEALLAYVIVLDQFSRNMFRGHADSFAGDGRALAAATLLVERGWDRAMPALKRWFVYLPFEHSERLDDQDRCIDLMRALEGDAATRDAVEWAHRHRDVIRRFGRFPHRNAILGRVSTPAEVAFLQQPGSSF
jgi:uncharacterized protein (DUF924 family)